MKIKKDDYVQVISGVDQGKRGRILKVFPEAGRAIVEGINYIYRHVRKTSKNAQSGRVQKEAPIAVSKLKLYCPHCQSTTRVHYGYEEESTAKKDVVETKTSKTKVRYCKCKRRI